MFFSFSYKPYTYQNSSGLPMKYVVYYLAFLFPSDIISFYTVTIPLLKIKNLKDFGTRPRHAEKSYDKFRKL